MRRLAPILCLLAGCAADDLGAEPADPVEAAEAYVDDARVRRAALERSVGVADTPYGRVRFEHYSLSGAGIDDPWTDWDLTPVIRRGPIRRLRVAETADDPVPEPFEVEPVIDDLRNLEGLEDYIEAGRRALELCPIQVDIRFARLRRSAEAARSYGLHVTDDGEVRGAVEMQAQDGRWVVAITCSACHSSTDAEGVYRPGLSNPSWDIARLLGAPIWRPGTMDVTGDGISNPIRAADLRPIQFQDRLQHTGNIGNGRIARMIRIETLIAGLSGWTERPPRPVVAAMALYLESLGDALPEPVWEGAGAEAFAANCASCHQGDAMSGPPIPVGTVGTDPEATRAGSGRGTLAYRTPSLRGVGVRRALLHDGSAWDLRALLRLDPSEHVGHEFGTSLPVETREAIVAFLR